MATLATSFFATGQVLKGLNTAEWRHAAANSVRETAKRARSDGPKWRKRSPKRSTSPMSPGRAKADGSKGSTSMRSMWDLVQGVDVQRTTLIKDSKDQIVKSFSSALVGSKRAASLSRWVVGTSITEGGDGRDEAQQSVTFQVQEAAPEKGAIKLPPPTSSTGMGRPSAKEPVSAAPMPEKSLRASEDWSSSLARGAAGLTDFSKGLKMGGRWSLGTSSSAPSLRPLPSGVRLSPIKRSDESSDITVPVASEGSSKTIVEKSLASKLGAECCKSSPDLHISAMQEDLGIKPQGLMTPKRLTPVKQHARKMRRMEKRAGSVPTNGSLPASPAGLNASLRGMQSQIDLALTAGWKAIGRSDNKEAGAPEENAVDETKKALSFADKGKDAEGNEEQLSDWDEDDLPFFLCSVPPMAEGDAAEESPIVEASAAVVFDACLAFDDYDEDLPFFELQLPARPTRGRSSSPPRFAKAEKQADKLGETLEAFRRSGTFCGSLPSHSSWEWPLAHGEALMCQQAFAGGWGLSHQALPMAATVA